MTPTKAKIQKKKLEYAKYRLEENGIDIVAQSEYQIQFFFQGHKVYFFPRSGWHSGSTIIDGRGLNNLLKQLNNV